MPILANTPVQEPANEIDGLLIQFAERLASEMGVSRDENTVANIISKIRWYPNKAGAIVIVKRGSDRTVLATISPKSGKWSDLYPSWERALANLEAKKISNGVSRASHDDLEAGAIPSLADKSVVK